MAYQHAVTTQIACIISPIIFRLAKNVIEKSWEGGDSTLVLCVRLDVRHGEGRG